VETYERQSDPWSALADRTRRTVLQRLASGPKSVGELAAGLPVSRPAVSQHLRVLASAGLVRHEAVGTRHVYQVRTEGLASLRAELDAFWHQTLSAFAEVVDKEEGVE
jgi:DNA-binding transcriptional ArsR family regulator